MKSTDLLLETLPESGGPPKTRVKDAASAREIYQKLRRADEESARNRSQIDEMLAGVPPYDDAELVATGQAARANVNFGEADGLLESALSGYVDLLSSVETLVNFKTRFGEASERAEWEQTISEELTRMLRGWASYTPNWLRLSTHFVAHGVGIAYFESDQEWMWRVGGLSDFLIPRKTLASESEIEVCCCARSMQCQQLYRYIQDEEVAKNTGWNVEAVKSAIKEAVSGSSGVTNTYQNWEEIVKELKSNDLHMGLATASEIKIVHVWNLEFDGRVTHSIILEHETTGSKEFLYRKVGKFSRMEQAFTIFTYGVGTTGQYHSIRGLGAKIFTEIQASNRLRCQLLDGAMLSSSVMLQPTNEEALQNLQLSFFGPYSILTPGIEIVERSIPNVSTSVMPVLQDMSRLINARTGIYAAQGADIETREKTKYEIKSEQVSRARLSTASLQLFYDPLDRLFREVTRRVCRKDYYPADPGGDAVREFRRRCHERNVPLEAIYEADIARVTATRAIGAGSEQTRQLAFDDFSQLAPAFDEAGRQNLLRDRVAARVGYALADRYVQKPTEDARPSIDEKFAVLETSSLLKGEPLPVYPNDLHRVHAKVHLASLTEKVQGLNEGADDIVAVLPGLVTLMEHSTQHVEIMSSDPMLQEESAANRQALQQVTEVITNGARHVEKLQRQQAEQAQRQPGQAGPPPGDADMGVKLQQRLAEHQVKMQMLQQQAQLKLSLRMQEAQQKLAIRDAEAAQKLSMGA